MQSLHIVEIIWYSPHLHHPLSIVRRQTLYLRSSGLGQLAHQDSGNVSLTYFETKPGPVWGSDLGSPGRGVRDVQHLDAPVSRIHSSRIEFADA
jgi:hypothetical protein